MPIHPRDPELFAFEDDGETPNNPNLPLTIYRGPVAVDGAADPAAVFEKLFAANGWKDGWRNGIYGFRHFHTRAHEVLGIARGYAMVEFGGGRGRQLELRAGDIAILPAGTGHRRLAASADLLVVGAYPGASDSSHVRPSELDHAQAIAEIASVKLPEKDPVYGKDGPLMKAWRPDRLQ